MTHLNETQVLYFLIQFTLLFVVARILADIMKLVLDRQLSLANCSRASFLANPC